MDIDSAFESDAQLAHACEPRVRASTTQRWRPSRSLPSIPCERAWRDAPLLEVMTATFDIVGLISLQLAWPTLRASWLAGDRRQGIDQFLEVRRVVPVGSSHAERRGNAIAADDQMPLAVELAAIGRVRPGVRAPRGRPHWPRPDWLGSGPACRLAVIRPAGPDAGAARLRRPASRATGANRSCRCLSPIPGAVLPMGCQCAGHRRCR